MRITYVECRVVLTCNLFKLQHETFILLSGLKMKYKLSSYTNQRSHCDFESSGLIMIDCLFIFIFSFLNPQIREWGDLTTSLSSTCAKIGSLDEKGPFERLSSIFLYK